MTGDGAKGAVALRVLGEEIGQIGIVVPDLDVALEAHAAYGSFSIWTYDRSVVPGLHEAERPADYRFRIALNAQHPQIELIQPLDDRSTFARWLGAGHSGVHHLGYLVEDIAATTAAMEEAGFAVIAGGTGHGADGTGGFCYYDTIAAVGYITEAIERPARRRDPEFTTA